MIGLNISGSATSPGGRDLGGVAAGAGGRRAGAVRPPEGARLRGRHGAAQAGQHSGLHTGGQRKVKTHQECNQKPKTSYAVQVTLSLHPMRTCLETNIPLISILSCSNASSSHEGEIAAICPSPIQKLILDV